MTTRVCAALSCAMLVSSALANPTDFIASGADAASIQATVTAFNTAISLGAGNNGVGGGPFVTGRREVNWDAAGLDAFQSPGVMPDNFFNANSKRGSVFHAPVGNLAVSKRIADASSRFGDVEASYNTSFQTFSPLRLFGVVGGTEVDASFFVPNNTAQAASINGFGAVFSDVDRTDSTALEFYGEGNVLLRRILVPASPDGGLSFAGSFFGDGERITGVKVFAGNAGLGAGIVDSGTVDVVAMDDFFYSEPLAVPGPASLALLGTGLMVGGRRRR